MLEAVEDIVTLLEPAMLPPAKLGTTFERAAELLADSAKRRAERAQRRQAEDFDEEEAAVLEVCGAFSWVGHGSVYPSMHPCLPSCALWQCSRTAHEHWALEMAGRRGHIKTHLHAAVAQLAQLMLEY